MKMKILPQMMMFWTKSLEERIYHLMKNCRNRLIKFTCKRHLSSNEQICGFISCTYDIADLAGLAKNLFEIS